MTGAGTGIGKAVALGLLNGGLCRRACRGVDRTRSTHAHGAGSSSYAGRFNERQPIRVGCRAVCEDTETFGRLDVLFNNAGIGAPAVPLEDLTFEQWKNVVDINLTGVFLCTREAID